MAKSQSDEQTSIAADYPPRRSGRDERRADAEIAQRAYALYEARGYEDGHDVDDWLRAEREVRRARESSGAPRVDPARG